MIQLLVDENFDQRILRGLKLRVPELDAVTTQATGLRGLDDPVLLDWAALSGKILLTHDVNTVTKFANERLRNLLPMPGVIIVPEQMEIGPALDELEVVLLCCNAADFENQILYLPL